MCSCPRTALRPCRCSCMSRPSKAIRPRQTTTRRFLSSAISSSSHGAQLRSSSGRWLVARRSAACHRRNPKSVEFHAIVARVRARKRSKARFVQDRIEKISRTVAGEGPTGSVGAMRAGSKSQCKNTRTGISERGHRAPPVLPFGVGASSNPRNSRCSALADGDSVRKPRFASSKPQEKWGSGHDRF